MAVEKMTPSAYRLVPYKPHFHYAIRFTARLDFTLKNKDCIAANRSLSAAAQPKQEGALIYLVTVLR